MTARGRTIPAPPLRWRTPITVLAIVLAAAALVGNAIVATPTAAPQPVDFSTFGAPGGAILQGHWSGVFRDPIIQAGPLELMFWGVPYLLGVSGLTGWIAFEIVASSVLTVAVAIVLRWVLRPYAPAWGTPLAVALAAVAALTGYVTMACSVGHPSEVVVPLLWVVAGVLARRARPMWAAAVLASTAGWELWGLLALPVLLLVPRIDVRAVAVALGAGIVVLAILFVPFALLGPFRMFEFAWVIRPGTLAHLLFPHARTFAWPLRAVQGVLALGAGVVTALFLRTRIDAVWLVPLVICVVRLIADPVLANYYEVPPLLLLLLGLGLAIVQRAWVGAAIALVTINVLVDLHLTPVTAAVVVVLCAVLAAVTIRGGPDVSRSRRPSSRRSPRSAGR